MLIVSEGEIRAFRDQDNMKFKKADVEKLRRGGRSDASAETLADDLIFDEDEDLDLSDDEPGMAVRRERHSEKGTVRRSRAEFIRTTVESPP